MLMKKRALAALTAALMTALPLNYVSVSAADPAPTSGQCGDENSDISWEIDEKGALTITGSGRMADFWTETGGIQTPWTRSEVTSATIGEGITYVGAYAFCNCGALESVDLPDSLTEIGDWAFSGGEYVWSDSTYKLTAIDIPANVTSIGDSAFYNLISLEEVTVPDSVSFVGARAFGNTPWLNAMKEGSGGELLFIGSVLIDASGSEGELVIPDGTTGVAGYTVSENKALTSIVIPDSVQYIGSNAFEYCYNVTSITIGNGVTSIGDEAFIGCNAMKEISIPKNVSHIGSKALMAKVLEAINVDKDNTVYSSLDGVLFNKDRTVLLSYPTKKPDASYAVPDGVERLDPYSIYNISALKEVTLPDSLTSIGEYAFSYCNGLQTIVIPDSVTELGNEAFDSCGALRSVHVGSGVKSLSSSLFARCSSLTDVELSEGLETLERYSFCWCSALEHLTLPSTVKDIATEAFWCCLELKDIELNSGLESIGPQCFYQCEKLDNVMIPDTVTSIGEKAFFECTSLKEIVIPASVTDLAYLNYGTTYSVGVFDGCSSLEKAVILAPITRVSPYLFQNCTSLKEVVLPDTVNYIGEYAFAGCSSLESLQFPKELYSIGNNAFKGSGLRSAVIPYGTYYLGKGAFAHCTSLVRVDIPDTVSLIYNEAFSGCTALKEVYVPEKATVYDKAFVTFSSSPSYSYELFALSQYGAELYDGCTAKLYIRTENPDPDSFYVSTSMPYEVSNTINDDVEYKNDNDKHEFKAVEGGYLWSFSPSAFGTYQVTIIEKNADGSETLAKRFSIVVNDYDSAYDAWMDEVIASQTDDSMDSFEKMSAVSNYLLSEFKYLTNYNDYLITLASEPNYPVFTAKHWDSYISPAALCNFARRIGGFDFIDNLYSHYAMYGFSRATGHYLCYCEINGEGKFYQACPLTPTGTVEPTPIDFTDPSKLYQISGMTEEKIVYTPLTIKGVAGSNAETFASDNGIKFQPVSGLAGDLNDDGEVNIADAVLLQKWLIAKPGQEPANWRAGDLAKDGKLSLFDLIALKQLITA